MDQKDFFRHCSEKQRSNNKKKIPSLGTQEVKHAECKQRHENLPGGMPAGPQNFCKGHMELSP